MMHSKHKLKHPDMRILLLDSLLDLGDKPYQLENWVDKNYLHAFWDCLRFPVEVLFDDLSLHEVPEDQINYTVYNQDELEVVMPVIKALEKVMDEIGRKQPDDAYIDSPLWNEVVKTAQHAFKFLMKKETMTEEYKERWNATRMAFCKKPVPLSDLQLQNRLEN